MEELKKNEKLEQLENVDFSKDSFNVSDAYDTIKNFKAEYEDLKKLESENVLSELSPIYLDEGYVEKFQAEKENIRSFVRKYDPNSEEIKNMNDGEIAQVYQVATYLFNVWQLKLNEMSAVFSLSKDEYKLIDRALNHTIEYDVNEALNLADLKRNWLDAADLQYKTLVNVRDANVNTRIEIGKCVILYHLIAKLKVKGGGSDFRNLLSLMQKIGDINKIFNALTVIKERLSSEIMQWVNNLPIDVQSQDVVEEVTAEEVQ